MSRPSRRFVVGLALLAVPVALVAGSVGTLTTFANDTVADANDVNANFDALKTAVDDNHARLSNFTFGTGGSVGVGRAPQARLDVAGGLRVGNDTTCDGTKAGTLRWTGTALEVCDGATFVSVSTGGVGALGSSTNPAASCKAIKAATNTTTSTTYWVDPDGAGIGVLPFEVYCDMSTDGGGWTLVRVDDATSKAAIKSAGAVGTVPKTLSCPGTNAKLSDAVIRMLWTEKLRFTVWNDSAGDMTYLSDTVVSGLTSWSDKCGSANVIRWYFKRAPTVLSGIGTHAEYCGWSFGPCAGGQFCWYGPHDGYRNHMNSGTAHISIPANLAALGNEQGCGFGWVR